MNIYKYMSNYIKYTYNYTSICTCLYNYVNVHTIIRVTIVRYTYNYICIYITLTSINLFPSLIISISLRLINIRNNLAFSGLAPYS